MGNKNISMAVIRRLPKYYRYLGELLDNDVQRISSKELSEIIGFSDKTGFKQLWRIRTAGVRI